MKVSLGVMEVAVPVITSNTLSCFKQLLKLNHKTRCPNLLQHIETLCLLKCLHMCKTGKQQTYFPYVKYHYHFGNEVHKLMTIEWADPSGRAV